jgi:hypothetical protein
MFSALPFGYGLYFVKLTQINYQLRRFARLKELNGKNHRVNIITLHQRTISRSLLMAEKIKKFLYWQFDKPYLCHRQQLSGNLSNRCYT